MRGPIMTQRRCAPSPFALCSLMAMLACVGPLGCSGKGDNAALEKRIVNLEKKVEALNKRVARAERARRRRPPRPPAPQESAAPPASVAPAVPSAAK
jgi:hypothetical protein